VPDNSQSQASTTQTSDSKLPLKIQSLQTLVSSRQNSPQATEDPEYAIIPSPCAIVPPRGKSQIQGAEVQELNSISLVLPDQIHALQEIEFSMHSPQQLRYSL
jgi:hypothetical protein